MLTHSFALKSEIRPIFEGSEPATKYQAYHRRLKEHAGFLNDLMELVLNNLDTNVNVGEDLKVALYNMIIRRQLSKTGTF